MQAVVMTGGKQYRVSEGNIIRIEKISGEVGEAVALKDVLLVGDGDGVEVGNPYVEGTEVVAEVLRHARSKKIIVFKKKRRKGYSKKSGHRQQFTELRIKEIKTGDNHGS